MTTRIAKNASRARRAIAPRLGTHFMYRKDRMFIVTAPQMNRNPMTVSHPWFPPSWLPHRASSAAIAVAVRVPPSQIGLESQ